MWIQRPGWEMGMSLLTVTFHITPLPLGKAHIWALILGEEKKQQRLLPYHSRFSLILGWAFLVVQTVENLPATQETWVRPLGQKDPLEKETAIHSSILAWRIPWTEKSGELQSIVLQRLARDWATNVFTFRENIGYSPSWLSKVLIHSIVRGECE